MKGLITKGGGIAGISHNITQLSKDPLTGFEVIFYNMSVKFSKYDALSGNRFDELLRYKNSIKIHFSEESENDDFLSWHEHMFF